MSQIDSSEYRSLLISIFCKSLYGFLILKLVFIAPVIDEITIQSPFTFDSFLSKILYAPLHLLQDNLYLLVFLALLFTGLFIKVNYISASLIFWFSFSLSRLTLPIINGADAVLNLFLLIAILLPVTPRIGSFSSIQNRISNVGLLLVKLELALIYLQSGIDKLMSPAWRSGSAIYSITNLTFHQNPLIEIEFNNTMCFIASWTVILFELGFASLIWFDNTRRPLLISGIIFHMGIAFFLGLPDFAAVMIIGYIPFCMKIKDQVGIQT